MTNRLFAGCGTLTRFIIRRDRVRLIIWLAGLAGFVVCLVPVFENLLTTGTDNRVMAEMMKNPAMIAIVGPVYGADNYTTGAAFGNMMLVFSVMIAGVMNIYLISRHTRQDEELGRLEVIRSLPVGRLANLSSAMIAALAVDVALAVASGLGLYALRESGMELSGCMLFGASMGVTGLLFASATALFCQVTANNRTAVGFSFLLMLVLYILRAAGDMGTEILSILSPLGLILRTQTFVNDYWWPVFTVLGLSAVISAVSLALARIRDLGRGLVSERPGRSHASALLSGAGGLALKLIRTSVIVWSVTIFILAAMYGSVFEEMESFMGGNEMLKAIFSQVQGVSLTEQFIALLMAIMSMIAAIPVTQCVNRVYAEERRGHAEYLLGRSVSRHRQMASYLLPAAVLSVILQVLTALGFWLAGSVVMDSIPPLGTFMLSALSYLPALWVFIGLSLILTAYFPSAASLPYIYLGYTFVTVYLGAIAGFPEWTKKLTPFGHIPQYPIEELRALPLAILAIIAVCLSAAGFLGYRNRDMITH